MSFFGVGKAPAIGDSRINNKLQIEIFDGNDWQVQQGPTGPHIQSVHSAGAVGANGPPGPVGQAVVNPLWDNSGSLSIHNAAFQAHKTISVDTKHGRITLNFDTGDLTFPPGIGRDQAVLDFWLGFHKAFDIGPDSKTKKELARLEQELAAMKLSVLQIERDAESKAKKKVLAKFEKKYGHEKLIMVRPDDLIKFLSLE